MSVIPLPAAPAPAVAQPLTAIVEAAAPKRYNVDADLITSVIAVESNFDPKAVRARSARLMQLLPETAAQLGRKKISTIRRKTSMRARATCADCAEVQHNLVLALAAYNAARTRAAIRQAFRLLRKRFPT